MTLWTEELLAMAKRLPRDEQLRLAQRLQDEVDTIASDAVRAAWYDEIGDRVDVLERGDAELLDAAEVLERARARLAR